MLALSKRGSSISRLTLAGRGPPYLSWYIAFTLGCALVLLALSIMTRSGHAFLAGWLISPSR